MSDFISEIRMFGGNFAILGWALCRGQIMTINDNTALFALLGTTYGGDGITTFGLPDLRSRVAVGTGQGPGLSNRVLGELSGTEVNTLTANNIGNHTHPLTGSAGILVSSGDGHQLPAINNFPAVNGDNIYSSTTDNTLMAAAQVALTTGPAGSPPTPIDNMKPYLCINFIICLEGIFPSRN